MKTKIKFNKSPALARRIIAYSDIKKLDIDPAIVALAGEDVVDPQLLIEAGLEPTDTHIRVLQNILDAGGRYVLGDTNRAVGATIALIGAIKQNKQVLILADPSDIKTWIDIIHRLYPEKPIHYSAKQDHDREDLNYQSRPDKNAEILISNFAHMQEHGLYVDFRNHQVILGERKYILHMNLHNVSMLMKVIPSVLIIFYADPFKSWQSDVINMVQHAFFGYDSDKLLGVFLRTKIGHKLNLGSGYKLSNETKLLALLDVNSNLI